MVCLSFRRCPIIEIRSLELSLELGHRPCRTLLREVPHLSQDIQVLLLDQDGNGGLEPDERVLDVS